MEKDETKFHGLGNNHLLKDKSYHFCTALNENWLASKEQSFIKRKSFIQLR